MAIKHIDPVYIYITLKTVQADDEPGISMSESDRIGQLEMKLRLLSRAVESLVDSLLDLQKV